MMDDSKVPGMSSKEQRFVYNSTFSVRKFYNVVFRKENARKMAKIYRDEHKEYVSKSSPGSNNMRVCSAYYARHSIHGIGYIFDRYLSVVDRALLLLAVLVFLGLATALMVDFRQKGKMSR